MRTLIDPNNPVMLCHITPYDMGLMSCDVGDFVVTMLHGPEDLKQMIMTYNGMTNINIQQPGPFTGPNTVMFIHFRDRDAMNKYLKGEYGDENMRNIIRGRLKEFFNEPNQTYA